MCKSNDTYVYILSFTNYVNESSFFYINLTLSENESHYSLVNISTEAVKKAHCKIIRAALFRYVLRILS